MTTKPSQPPIASYSPLSPTPRLTIQDLLQLPRPGAGIPNPAGTLALWPSSTLTFTQDGQKSRTERSLRVIDLKGRKALSLADGDEPREGKVVGKVLEGLSYTEAVWLDDSTFVYLRPPTSKKEEVTHWHQNDSPPTRGSDHEKDVMDTEQAQKMKDLRAEEGGEGIEIWAMEVGAEESAAEYLVGSLPVGIANLKVVPINSTKDQGAILAFSAEVYPDGDIFTVAAQKKKLEEEARGSDVRVYDSLFVRHWDEFKSTTLQQVFFVRLSKNPESFASTSDISDVDDEFEHIAMPAAPLGSREGKWSLLTKSEKGVSERKVSVKSPMEGTGLECPVGPFGSGADFSISSTHLLFHAKDPLLNPAWHTRTQVYLVPLSPRNEGDSKPRALTIGNQGATSSPAFSVDGKRIAWLEMREDGYEADRNRVMIYEVESEKRYGVTEDWDRSPSAVVWCPCGAKVYLSAEDEGRVKIWQHFVPLSGKVSSEEPQAITHKHSVTHFETLSTSELLVTYNSLTHPNQLAILSLDSSTSTTDAGNTPPPAAHLKSLATLTPHLAKAKDLSPGESFWFAGNGGVQVHGWILYPPGFKEAQAADKGRKWPMAFMVHGGPQGAWTDSWSTRWNPNIYTAAGYIVVSINPTGSTGYGQEFCDAIKEQWGGKPFQDLVAGLEFVKIAYPEIDPERMCMLGASYGGYMANWIQGHNDVMGFKAIVCHDGVFSTSGTWYTTDELYFAEREFGGVPWNVPDNYNRWDPRAHIKNWKTPQLVIHGGRDYRLVDGEGIGVFNTLQRLNIPSRFVYFGSENHWVLNAHNGVRWHEEVLKWCDEWTGEEKPSEE